MPDRDYGHVCAHGSLARSCQVCDLEDEVRRLQAEVAGANENVASWQGIAADLREERDHYRVWISAMYDDEHLWRDQGEARLRTNVRMTLAGALELGLIGDDRE